MFKFCGFINMSAWICLRLKHVEELPCPFQISILVTVMKISQIAKELVKDILAEEKESDFSPHQLLSFYLEELKDVCEIYIEFPGKIK